VDDTGTLQSTINQSLDDRRFVGTRLDDTATPCGTHLDDTATPCISIRQAASLLWLCCCWVRPVRTVHTFVAFIPSDSPRRFFLCLIHAFTGIEADRVGTELACVLVLAPVDGAVVTCIFFCSRRLPHVSKINNLTE
jgi:hypothetical protein